MESLTGHTLAPYRIGARLGAGGMGEVYRATDPKLGREVAIKVLPAALAQDPERLARFEREAKLLASLNHPNIAHVYGFECATLEDGASVHFLAMELVEGEDLSQRLKRGAIPIDEALPIARQIAEALEEAHEKGIVHRDLKPGNLMVTPDGKVKVLDFGLGKSLEAASGPNSRGFDPSLTHSPTLDPGTAAGLILGTAGYMSPEQARGRAADKRSDVWAFGCVLYEMLAGRRAFDGEDASETLAAIIRGEPDWAALPGETPPGLRTLVQRCLLKARGERLSDMSVVRFVLAEPGALNPADRSAFDSGTARAAMPRRRWWLVAAMALLVGWGLGRAWPQRTEAERAAAPVALTLVLPAGQYLANTNLRPLALSRDGRNVAYVASAGGRPSQLFVRRLDEPAARALEGTTGASMPFFSWDGEWIGFFAEGRLKKISTQGAGLQIVTDRAPYARGGAWGPDDTIYYAPGQLSGLDAVPASGGVPRGFTTVDSTRGEVSHRWPAVLPDGNTVLFTPWTGPGFDERWAAVQAVGEAAHHVLLSGADTAQYVDGHLVYGRAENLFSVPWRPGQRDLGRALPTPQAIHARNESEAVIFAVAEGGTAVYAQGAPERRQFRPVWVDRDGRTSPLAMALDDYVALALSPDGTRAVVQIKQGTETLWMFDLARNTLTPLTGSGTGSRQAPVWTPDGRDIYYRQTGSGKRNVFRRHADGSGDEERVTRGDGLIHTPTSISGDGQWLVYHEGGSGTIAAAATIFGLRLSGDDSSPVPLVQTPANNREGQISPDGRWLAYSSNRSGRFEVYAQPFPGPGPTRQLSVDGGGEPLWSPDGRELFFVPPSGDGLMVVDTSKGPANAGAPRLLFEGAYRKGQNGNTSYSVSPDGQRFLRAQPTVPDGPISRLEVVLNWKPAGR